MLSPAGEVVPLRCKRRHCPHCAGLEARELARVLTNDANEGTAPTVAITLTTSDPRTTRETFQRGVQSVVRRLRRRYGAQVEYMQMIEFTTGKGRRSGGHRRMHGHLLPKGLPLDHLADVEAIVRETWEEVTGAYIVEVAALRTVGGIIGYLGLHHMKPEQAPPVGWEGQRVRWSRGYLGGVTVKAARLRAKRELAAERLLWSIEEEADLADLPPEWVGQQYELRMRERTASSEGTWSRVRLHPLPAPPESERTAARAVPPGAQLHAIGPAATTGRTASEERRTKPAGTEPQGRQRAAQPRKRSGARQWSDPPDS